MAILQLDALQPGMVLAADAIHLNGRVLLRVGGTLTEQHLRVFRMWGLSEADIVGADPERLHDEKLAAADPVCVERERAALNDRFHHTDSSHPVMVELFRWCLEQSVRKTDQ